MVTQTLLTAGAAVGPGPIVNFPQSNLVRTFQFNPVPTGFSGAVTIETSYAASPGDTDFQTAVTVTFTAHKDNFKLDVGVDAPWVRARLVSATVGTISVFGTSKLSGVSGGSGTTLANATAVISSPYTVGVTGNKVHVTAPVVPSITSDDVAWVEDPTGNTTITEEINSIKGTTPATATQADLDLLTGLSGTTACGVALTNADFCKLATTATLGDLNNMTGTTGNVQTQLDGKVDGTGVDLTGWTTDVSWVNSFFDASPTVTVSQLSASLTGLTATAADLNALTGTAGTFTSADLTKLGLITASASELNALNGFTGNSTDLNKLSGMTASTADLNAITGLAGTGVTTTELQYLSGLTQNVQAALLGVPSLAGLTATVSDLNLLDGASTGTAGYPGIITKTEIGHLSGVSSNIQTQLNAKRDSAVAIGIGEISGSSITITELNYSQGLTGNIQAQIDGLTLGSITTAGGTFTGPIYIADGLASAPGLGYAGQNTTGLYLEGVGVGLSVTGTRAMSLDATYMRVGAAATNGQPTLNASTSVSDADPTYAFTNDEDSGMVWGGTADSLHLVMGGDAVVEAAVTPAPGVANVNLGGAVAQNYTVGVSGVANFEKVLGRATVDGLSTGQTPIFTVPVGRTAIVTRIYVVILAGAVVTVPTLVMDIGWAGSYNQLVDNGGTANIFTPVGYNWDTAGQVMPLGVGDNTFPGISGASGAAYGIITSANGPIATNVTTVQTGTSFNMDVIVFGYEW